MRKGLGDKSLLGALFLWPAFLPPSLLGRLFSRPANWSGSLWWDSVSGSFDRGSDLEGIALTWPHCAVHSVLLDERLIAGGSWGSKSLYMSFLRGFRDAICSFVFFFLGSEPDTASTSETTSTDSATFSFERVSLSWLEPVPMVDAGLGWASLLVGRGTPIFGRVSTCSCSLCVRVLLTRLSARGFTAGIVS